MAKCDSHNTSPHGATHVFRVSNLGLDNSRVLSLLGARDLKEGVVLTSTIANCVLYGDSGVSCDNAPFMFAVCLANLYTDQDSEQAFCDIYIR